MKREIECLFLGHNYICLDKECRDVSGKFNLTFADSWDGQFTLKCKACGKTVRRDSRRIWYTALYGRPIRIDGRTYYDDSIDEEKAKKIFET